MVYEGFWDLYTFRPQIRDVSSKRLLAWIQKIRLQSGPDRSVPKEGEDEEEKGAGEDGAEDGEEQAKKPGIDLEAEDTFDPIAAVVRLKIPKVVPEPEQDEEGNDIVVEYDESDLEDIPFEDKCLKIEAKKEDQNIWVINHLAQKTLR